MSRLDTAVLSLRITAIVVALWGLGSLSLAVGASQLYGSKFEDLPATLDADVPEVHDDDARACLGGEVDRGEVVLHGEIALLLVDRREVQVAVLAASRM